MRDTAGTPRWRSPDWTGCPAPAYAAIQQAIPGLKVIDIGAELATLRRRKSPLEIERAASGGHASPTACSTSRASEPGRA